MSQVVVTGGVGVLGTAVVAEMLARGHQVTVPAMEPAGHANLTGWTHADVEGVTLVPEVDLTNEESVRRFYAGLPELEASIHVAGGFRWGAIGDTSLETFRFLMDINAVTCFLCCKNAAQRMKQGGRIVNVAARPVTHPTAMVAAYAASKAAVSALTTSLAEELRGDRILVNAVLPSLIDTPTNRESMPDADHSTWPSARQIAQTIGFLASTDNVVTSGSLVPVFGQTG